ncbi:AtpZ/AtpI family protein [Candidatus Blastococcus massiliensis]|uniref:AtpZ/AtpI family protein n=1 Tax=Candidatus Blastococcus massiliensis TaxID=1470358 RepID=UPI0005906309|nr:AtpZ/AtpI family protein [Candidatus Blastococcus massiliensis]
MAENTSRDNGSARSRPASPARQPSGADIGWSVTGTLISGMAVWGGVGWLIDRWLDLRLFAPIGIVLGMAVAIYVVVVKYGAVDPPPGSRSSHTTGGRASRSVTQKGQR